jgi:hypothetical protein
MNLASLVHNWWMMPIRGSVDHRVLELVAMSRLPREEDGYWLPGTARPRRGSSARFGGHVRPRALDAGARPRVLPLGVLRRRHARLDSAQDVGLTSASWAPSVSRAERCRTGPPRREMPFEAGGHTRPIVYSTECHSPAVDRPPGAASQGRGRHHRHRRAQRSAIAIVRKAKRVGADLIVLGTHGRTPRRGRQRGRARGREGVLPPAHGPGSGSKPRPQVDKPVDAAHDQRSPDHVAERDRQQIPHEEAAPGQ